MISDVEVFVKPILEEMGLFNGKDVSVKETYEKYLKIRPRGLGPLGVFKRAVEYKLQIFVKKVLIDGNIADYLFIYKPENNILNYDPRI